MKYKVTIESSDGSLYMCSEAATLDKALELACLKKDKPKPPVDWSPTGGKRCLT